MRKIMILALLVSSVNAIAANWAPINGSCQIKKQTARLEFPTGSGSLFPVFKDGTILSVFAGPSENLAVDEKGVNLFDITISANDKKGSEIGNTVIRHLSAQPNLKREISFELRNGNIVNCEF